MATNVPFFSVIVNVLTPFPPRFVLRYSWIEVRLPNPFSVTTKISWFIVTISIPTATSPSSKKIPRTPAAVRPIGRTSVSSNQTAFPPLDAIIISDVFLTPISSSSSRKERAIKPLVRIWPNADNVVRFTTPERVAKNKNSSSLNSLTGMIALMYSSWAISIILTIGNPLAVRPYSGIV